MASVLLVALLVLASFQVISPGEKNARTPAQQKLSSQLLSAIRSAKAAPAKKQAPSENLLVKIDRRQRALVDVRAPVTARIDRNRGRSRWKTAESRLPRNSRCAHLRSRALSLRRAPRRTATRDRARSEGYVVAAPGTPRIARFTRLRMSGTL